MNIATCRPVSVATALMIVASWLAPGTAGAKAVVIDDTSQGAVYDAILDGFPGLAALDGVGDFNNNALAVSFKAQVTEQRAIIELPMAPLAAIDAAWIVAATLTVTIDDVLSTFGPGTDFNGQGATTIGVHAYAGNGAIELEDFARIGAEPVAVIDTSIHGAITDASLVGSGPLAFAVDVTDAVVTALEEDADFLGFVLTTPDSPTGTSMDDLGPGSAGPPGIGGARLPWLAIEWAAVTTTSSTTTSSTTTTTSTSSSTLPAAECGDADLDGRIAATDALIVLRRAVGLAQCPMRVCDTDSSGSISAGDALRVLQRAVGMSVVLVCR
jgi:hypothetical protein